MMTNKRNLLMLGFVPPLLVLVGVFLPAVNGPHLWLGIPSLMWWVIGSAVSVSVVLWILERRNAGDAR
jgi:hypothetical protein